MTPFFGALPFSLTGAQARAVDDLLDVYKRQLLYTVFYWHYDKVY